VQGLELRVRVKGNFPQQYIVTLLFEYCPLCGNILKNKQVIDRQQPTTTLEVIGNCVFSEPPFFLGLFKNLDLS
jgi:hypothetical protein